MTALCLTQSVAAAKGWEHCKWEKMAGAGTAINGHDGEKRDACYKRVPSCPAGLPPCAVVEQPFVVPAAPCCLGPRGIGWGLPFAALLGFAAVMYVGGGVAASPQRSIGGHPHYARWLELRCLCRDGVRFATSGGIDGKPPARGDYAPLPPADPSDGRKAQKGGKSRSSRERKRGKEEERRRGTGGGPPQVAASDGTDGGGADAAEEEAERQRAGVREQKHAGGLHESQAKIKVVGLNEM